MSLGALEKTMSFADSSLVVTDECGVIQFANEQVTQKTGFSLAEMVGKKPGELWGGNMKNRFYKRMWGKIKYEKEPFVGEVKNKKKTGVKYTELMFCTPVLGEYGTVEHYIELNPQESKAGSSKELLRFFSSQQENQSELPEFLLQQLNADQLNEEHKKFDSFTGFLFDTFVKPVKKKFKNRKKDEKLVEQAQEDPQKFRLLYDKYKEDIYNYFRYRISSAEKASDLTQESFTRAFKHLDDFKIKNASYKTYLMRIAHNLLVNHYRKEEKRSQVKLGEIPDCILSCFSMSDDVLVKDRLQYAMEECLTESQHKIMKMKYFDQLLVREIATVMQKSENAVKLHLHRGRKKLKQYLERNKK
ncbi:MAG: sigma-70 family RNA polymerase sigma factor [Candidatus Paceibacteria bacterium]